MGGLSGRPVWAKLLTTAVMLMLVATACSKKSPSSSGGNTPGVTATQILIGSHQPLTGPAAPGYSEISKASDAYFQWVNDHGGVFGRKISYKFLDDGYNPSNTTSVVKQLVLQDKVFAIFDGLGTPTHSAVVDYLNQQKVPDVFVASGCSCWDAPTTHPYTFGWQPDYIIEGKILGQYVKSNLAGKKVGYFYQNDDFGKDGVKGLDQQIPAASVASRQTYVTSNTVVGPAIAALQRAGVQVVVSYSIPAFTALALLTAAKLGYHPTWVVSSVGSDPVTLTGLLKSFSKGKAGGALLEGMVSGAYLPATGDSSNAWIALFKQIHDKYIPTLPFDGNVEYGLGVAYTFVQALKLAGQNLTRDALIKALESGNLKGGPGLVPFGYSSSSHLGFLGEQIFTIKGGVATLEGKVYQSTNDGPITEYTGGQSTPPADGIPT